MSDMLNAKRWRERADEARRLADGMTDAERKGLMLAVADAYERLAERAGQKAKTTEAGRS